MSSFISFDAHSCLPLSPSTSVQTLIRYKNQGVRYVSINVGMDFNPMSQIMAVLASFRKQIEESSELMLIDDWSSLEDAKEQNILGVGFDLEGAAPLLSTLDMVDLFSTLGVRQIHLAYNRNNIAAGGCHDSPQGLTNIGTQLIQRIQRSGIIVDMSHNSIRTSLDICSVTQKPVVFSHANVRELVEHPRNITNEQIRACARTNGVICINGVERFLGKATPQAFAQHCAYVADLVGVEHVGMGLDTMLNQAGIEDIPKNLDTQYWWPKEFYPKGIGVLSYLQPEDIPKINSELENIGFHQNERYMIFWNNMARVAKICWEKQ